MMHMLQQDNRSVVACMLLRAACCYVLLCAAMHTFKTPTVLHIALLTVTDWHAAMQACIAVSWFCFAARAVWLSYS